MADQAFSKEQVEALEKILGVKLPEQGFSLEIKPLGPNEMGGAQLEQVVGGVVGPSMLPTPKNISPDIGLKLPAVQRWLAKI
jgi:hypothetical protein